MFLSARKSDWETASASSQQSRSPQVLSRRNSTRYGGPDGAGGASSPGPRGGVGGDGLSSSGGGGAATTSSLSGVVAANASPGGSSSTASSYRVFIRIRPFLPTEAHPVDHTFPLPPVELRGSCDCHYIDMNTGLPRESFHFDGCFSSITETQWSLMSDLQHLPKESIPEFPKNASQEAIFQTVGRPMVDAVLDGFNASVLAYGQTSSGKTHTMMGTPRDEGLIPRIARAIMDEASQRTIAIGGGSPSAAGSNNLAASHTGSGVDSLAASFSTLNTPNLGPRSSVVASSPSSVGGVLLARDYSIELSFFEIYNETILDLLHQGTTAHRKRKVRVHPLLGVYVEGLSYQKVSTWEQCLKHLQKGLQQRHTATTKMNEASSRSHAIFQLRLLQVEMTDIGPVQRRSNVYLADLAGSERVKHSAVEGERLKESTQINLSLTTLRRVIDALISVGSGFGSSNSNAQGGASSPPAAASSSSISQGGGGAGSRMIPYRESMLTWVLSESLGGNAKACMVATLCPHPTYAEETYQTLQYAHRAKSIVNNVVKNEDQMARMIRSLQDALQKATNAAASSHSLTAIGGGSGAGTPHSAADIAAAVASRDEALREKDTLIANLREEQMLLLLRYADLKDAYDTLKEEASKDVEAAEQVREAQQRDQRRVADLTHEMTAQNHRIGALEVALAERTEALQHESMQREHVALEQAQRVHQAEFALAAVTRERDAFREEVEELSERLSSQEKRAAADLARLRLERRSHMQAMLHMQSWYSQAMTILFESTFASRRAALLTQLTTLTCGLAVQARAEAQGLRLRCASLEAKVADLELINHAQDKSLSQVAATYVDVRNFLRRADELNQAPEGKATSSASVGGSGGGSPPSSGSSAAAHSHWTVPGILRTLRAYCDAAQRTSAIPLRAASNAPADHDRVTAAGSHYRSLNSSTTQNAAAQHRPRSAVTAGGQRLVRLERSGAMTLDSRQPHRRPTTRMSSSPPLSARETESDQRSPTVASPFPSASVQHRHHSSSSGARGRGAIVAAAATPRQTTTQQRRLW